jgi:septal ring factor EnvC (AmiA/AmiB activator)
LPRRFYRATLLEVRRNMSLDRLRLLESKIGEVVDQHARVRQEHEALLQRLLDKEQQLAHATAQLKEYEQERSEIKARLERVLNRLESLDVT